MPVTHLLACFPSASGDVTSGEWSSAVGRKSAEGTGMSAYARLACVCASVHPHDLCLCVCVCVCVCVCGETWLSYIPNWQDVVKEPSYTTLNLHPVPSAPSPKSRPMFLKDKVYQGRCVVCECACVCVYLLQW